MPAGDSCPGWRGPIFNMKINCLRQNGLTLLALVLGWLCLSPGDARAFSLIGGPPAMNPVVGSAGRLLEGAGGAAAAAPGANFVDPLGQVVPIKQFFRWNYPQLTYAFDSTFVRYFGHNGMAAVSNAFEVLNDYFVPQNEAYTNGVSSINLITEYDGNFQTWEYNPTANLNNVTDMESMVLGLLVNHLGLGNPHRYCFVLQDVLNYNVAAANPITGTFHVGIRNFDPYTYLPTHEINGVSHGYWLYNDSPGNVNQIGTWDAVEYAVSGDNEFSAIAAIRDVINFGGLAWPGPAPTVFRTPGVFYAPDDSQNRPIPANRMTNRDQPRHTLTFDDAGGLRYLYRTNNIVVETLDATVTLVTPANMNPLPPSATGSVPPNSPFLTPRRRAITGLTTSGITPTPPAGGTLRGQPTVIIRQALRGGINKIQFKYTAFDSLLGTDYLPQGSVWTDVFITNALPTDLVPASPPYFSQVVQRTTTVPDIIFIANDLGFVAAANVIPVISLPDTTGWAPLIGPNSQSGAVASLVGPGTILLPAANTSLQYIFTTRAPFYQVIWSGEPGIEGNFVSQFQWGWITNTGPSDFVTFPESDITQVEAITGPAGVVPSITAISVLDGVFQDYKTFPFTIDRTMDTVFIYGQRTDSATEIQVLDSTGSVKQKINPRAYIMSDQLIKLPPGAFDSTAEGSNMQIRLVNAVGEGAKTALGTINAGIPLVTNTQYDGLPLNTRKSLIINGAGFRTSAGNRVTRIEFYDDNNQTNYNLNAPTPMISLDDNSTTGNGENGGWTVTDTQIYIPANYIHDFNNTQPGALYPFGGGMGFLNSRIRSDGNATDPTIDVFSRQIRIVRNDGSRSAPRPNPHKFSHIGIGGNRATTGLTWPTIMSVETNVTLPPGLSAADANATWTRSDDNDVLIIKGHGLDLAFLIEFVDGAGHLIQSTDGNGLPPQPISLRAGVQPSALVSGIDIRPLPALGNDGFEIRIRPVAFGMNGNPLYDTVAANNLSGERRVVIRTPFGTAIAPRTQFIWITN